MADGADEVVAACCSLVLAAGLGAAIILNKSRKRKHSTWVKPYVITIVIIIPQRIYARNDVIDVNTVS